MCGIAGISGRDGLARVGPMLEMLRHRGPDDSGTLSSENFTLGATRLSIIDVQGGHQPLANEDGMIWAALNGEIYNFKQLRTFLESKGHIFRTATDTEILVHLYEEYDTAMVHALDGMYAFAIWDDRRRRLVLARDRLGEKPLFVRRRETGIAFASEVTAFQEGTRSIDPAAIDLFYSLGYIPAPRTVYREVEQLKPGTVVVWNHDLGVRETAYWTPLPYANSAPGPGPLLVDETVSLLAKAVESRLSSDVPIGAFLSGGIDSTLVTGLASQLVGPSFKTFSVGYDVGGVSETEPARRVAKAIGTDHRTFTLESSQVATEIHRIFSRLDQPIADPALIALSSLSQFAREFVTVAIGGEGADEVFGGYPRYNILSRLPTGLSIREARGSGRYARLSRAVGASSTASASMNWVNDGRMRHRRLVYGERLTGFMHADATLAMPLRAVPAESRASRLMRWDKTYWLADDVLAKADRASMLASLELRTPFLARDVLEFAASVPTAVHLSHGGKHLLRCALQRVVPSAVSRKKVAFRVPVADWLRSSLRVSFEQQLEESWIYDGWFDRRAVRNLFQLHTAGEKDVSAILWPIYTLGAWTPNA